MRRKPNGRLLASYFLSRRTQTSPRFQDRPGLDADVVADDASLGNERLRTNRYAAGENCFFNDSAGAHADPLPEHRFANGRIGADAARPTEHDVRTDLRACGD